MRRYTVDEHCLVELFHGADRPFRGSVTYIVKKHSKDYKEKIYFTTRGITGYFEQTLTCHEKREAFEKRLKEEVTNFVREDMVTVIPLRVNYARRYRNLPTN